MTFSGSAVAVTRMTNLSSNSEISDVDSYKNHGRYQLIHQCPSCSRHIKSLPHQNIVYRIGISALTVASIVAVAASIVAKALCGSQSSSVVRPPSYIKRDQREM